MKVLFRNKKGFTLIELLVVIAIIGILAGIVLVSVSGAIKRAKDARISADMGQLRSAAEVYQGDKGSYKDFCSSTEALTLQADIASQGGTGYDCWGNSASTSYCAEVKLNSGSYWCVDSALRSISSTTITNCVAGASTSCQ